jgi:hypothetical protein
LSVFRDLFVSLDLTSSDLGELKKSRGEKLKKETFLEMLLKAFIAIKNINDIVIIVAEKNV